MLIHLTVREEKFGQAVLAIAFLLGLTVLAQSLQVLDESHEDESYTPLINMHEIPQVDAEGLRLWVVTDKTEYRRGEEITAQYVVINDFAHSVMINPPSTFGATSYSRAAPDDKISQAVSVTWAESKIVVPPGSTVVLARFHFRCDEVGGFVIEAHGCPETEVMVGVPHAWILGGRTGGGSGRRIEVNSTDLQQFPHLFEAFEEDAKATARGYVHATRMTYCPALEAIDIIGFLREWYSTTETSYGFKLTMEDGSFYSFGIHFSWEPPVVA